MSAHQAAYPSYDQYDVGVDRYDVVDDFGYDDSLPSWRDIISGAKLSGPVRVLAATAHVVEMQADFVKLRIKGKSLAEQDTVAQLSSAITKYLGKPFTVMFEFGDFEGQTVLDQEEQERRREHERLVERFKQNVLVRQLTNKYKSTLDEDSVEYFTKQK